jgi:hypothetical protein
MLSVAMPNVAMLRVITLNVVAPLETIYNCKLHHRFTTGKKNYLNKTDNVKDL